MITGTRNDFPRGLRVLAWALVVAFAVFPMRSHANEPRGAAPKETVNPGDMDVLNVILYANSLRLNAVRDPGRMASSESSLAFSTKWNETIMPAFGGDLEAWKQFFASAIVFPGRIQSPKATIGYYNPWSDTALLLDVNFEDSKVLDGVVLCGEALRGDTLAAGSANHPAWESDNTSLAIALKKVYLSTEQAIEKLYPIQAPAEFLPQPLKDRIGPPQLQLSSAAARMKTRIEMTRKLVNPDNRGIDSAVGAKTQEILGAVRASDQVTFDSLAIVAQRTEVTRDIFSLPKETLDKMAPAYYTSLSDGAVVALVSEATPVLFISIYFEKDTNGGVSVKSVEAFRFDQLHRMK